MVDEKPKRQSHQRPSEQGDCGHKAFLSRGEPKIFGNVHTEHAQQHPDHETNVEVKKRRKKGRRMPAFHEIPKTHSPPLELTAKRRPRTCRERLCSRIRENVFIFPDDL